MQLKIGYAFSLRFGNIAIKKIHNIPDFMELKPSGVIDKSKHTIYQLLISAMEKKIKVGLRCMGMVGYFYFVLCVEGRPY